MIAVQFKHLGSPCCRGLLLSFLACPSLDVYSQKIKHLHLATENMPSQKRKVIFEPPFFCWLISFWTASSLLLHGGQHTHTHSSFTKWTGRRRTNSFRIQCCRGIKHMEESTENKLTLLYAFNTCPLQIPAQKTSWIANSLCWCFLMKGSMKTHTIPWCSLHGSNPVCCV